MKEYRTPLTAGFESGLRVEEVTVRNSALLVASLGCRIAGKALEGYSPDMANILDDIYGLNLTKRWPFPQVFLLHSGIYIGALEGLYKINDITVSPLTLYSFSTGLVTHPWTCAPIPEYPAFASGNVFVYYDSNAASYIVVM